MGGKSIDKIEMARLCRLVLQKGEPLDSAIKKFAIPLPAAYRYLKLAREGEFDYESYLIETQEDTDDRSIFAVADMIDFAVGEAINTGLQEIRELIKVNVAANQVFEAELVNRVLNLEKKMDRQYHEVLEHATNE